MIRQIIDAIEIVSEKISNDHYGRRFKALLIAYGVKYDFCRFYEILHEEKLAYFVVLNSSMTVSSIEEIDLEELSMFIRLHEIVSVEMPFFLAEKLELDGYNCIERVLFEFTKGDFQGDISVDESPKLDEVFEILKEGFSLDNCYELWLTDTSHQIRHGISKIFLYNSTTATMYYEIDNVAFFGQIATAANARGKGYARELLYWLEDKMSKNNVSSQLFAKPHRVSFYEGIGFKEIGRDLILERENI